MTATITAFYAAALGLMLMVLSGLVIRQRIVNKVVFGRQNKPALEQAIRAQGNFTEYVPLILVLMLLAELQGASANLLHGCGGALLLARVLQAWGLSTTQAPNIPRFIGTVMTFAVLGTLATVLLKNNWVL